MQAEEFPALEDGLAVDEAFGQDDRMAHDILDELTRELDKAVCGPSVAEDLKDLVADYLRDEVDHSIGHGEEQEDTKDGQDCGDAELTGDTLAVVEAVVVAVESGPTAP